MLNYEPLTTSSDMWSVGVLGYMLLSGYSPFAGDDKMQTFSNITQAKLDFSDDAFQHVSNDARDFISRLLVRSPRYVQPNSTDSYMYLQPKKLLNTLRTA